jgi:hypothetical protein
VWEHGGPEARVIRAAFIDADGAQGDATTVSSPGVNSGNPAVAGSPDGSAFAAWDSFRDRDGDLYGARSSGGRWQAERRLTRDPRLERHASVAAQAGAFWLAWQADASQGNRWLAFTEHQVIVARLDDAGRLWETASRFEPLALERVGPREPRVAGRAEWRPNLVRPRIAFDRAGRLVVTARQTLGLHAGWAPVVRTYAGRRWSQGRTLSSRQGRWYAVPVVPSASALLAAVQSDDRPSDWAGELGTAADPQSDVAMVSFDAEGKPRGLNTEALPPQPTTFRASDRIERSGAESPARQRTWNGKVLHLYWGNLHAHSAMSFCDRATDPAPDDLLALERDVDRLDFVALTDHDFSHDAPSWADTRDVVARYDDPPRFVTLLGEEWTSGMVAPPPGTTPFMMRYGHHNLIFANGKYPRFFDATTAEARSPAQVAGALGTEDFVMIPHALADWRSKGVGNPPVDWTANDPAHMPLAEIFQARGSYECRGCPRQAADACPFDGHYLRDAWTKGVVIGTIASPDHGGGEGYAGVWAEELSVAALFRAFHARHTFGTSGEKTALFFSTDGGMMGDRVVRTGDGPIRFAVWAASPTPIEAIHVFRNGEEVFVAHPGTPEASFDWRDEHPPRIGTSWYYVRVHARPGSDAEGEQPRLAWSSPIWFVRDAR